MTAIRCYRLRHKKTGEFHSGGNDPRFVANGGKIYWNKGAVRAVLQAILKYYPYMNGIYEIVAYDLIEVTEET